MKKLKNTTASIIELDAVGISISAFTTITLNVEDYIIFATVDSITEITTYINAGDLVVNDGIRDLSIPEGISYLSYPDTADNIRFLNDTDVGNGITGDTVQEAIEEVQTLASTSEFSYHKIINGVEVTIPEDQQMSVYGNFDLDGLLVVEGQLVLEK